MATLVTADGRLLRSGRQGLLSPVFAGYSRSPSWQTDSPDLDGRLVSFDRVYRGQPMVATAVDKLARRIGTLPFDSFRRTANDGRELVRGDSLDSLIRHPWPGASSVHLNAFIATSLLVHGNALVAKFRGPDVDAPPSMLWPLDWSQVIAYAEPGGRVVQWRTSQFDGVERILEVGDVIHFAWPAPSGSQFGVSPLEKLGVTVQNDDAAQRFQMASFRNGARPSLAVSVDKNLNAEQVEQVRQAINSLHQGVDQSSKTIVLAGGSSVEALSLNPVEAALIEQRKLNREEVGMVYDLPGPLMNDLSHATLANVAEYQKALYRDVVPTWTELMVWTYQAQLLDTEPAWLDRMVRFDFSDKLKGDPESLAVTLRQKVEGGLISRNEARRELGYEPDGDPTDPVNPANQLTANVNNQATLSSMGNAEQ